MPITLQNTTITGLSAGGLPNDTITAANMATNGGWAPIGAVVAVNTIRNGTRTSVAGATSAILFSGTFTKLRADTEILAFSTVFGAGYFSGNCGMGLRLNAIWDYGGCSYHYDGLWSATNQTTICTGQARWTGIPVGTNTMACGWNSRTAGGERPFNIFNPSSPDDGRNQQMVSSIVIFEVAT